MLADEVVEVRVNDSDVYFRSSSYGAGFVPIEGLKLSKSGVVKEFPELEEDPFWQHKAIQKFKEKIHSMKSEDEKITYIIEDLRKFGYTPKIKQKAGWRPQKL